METQTEYRCLLFNSVTKELGIAGRDQHIADVGRRAVGHPFMNSLILKPIKSSDNLYKPK